MLYAAYRDVRRDSNIQYYDESEDEAVDDLSLNLNRSSGFSSEMHPNITDSMVSLPVMKVTDFKQKSLFTSAPELHFTQDSLEATNERSSLMSLVYLVTWKLLRMI
ncbi:FYVE and coiled-coil domain-containing protein 1 [Nephila pilipes]|uniref:FYVE and coiled-coil domain-containing protein 1 n=1 Tax=Nephila pilipes TaxID=299642 RepID=A0A8X6MT75_NEPPI|nr:FYVE and coiled-coil domain-containing protein 1 [Nephila pilipes]